jgi:hypothetical protein
MEGGGQHHGAIVFVHGQMGCAAVYFALFKNGVERQNTVFAFVDDQHAAQGVAYVVDNFSFIEHKADNNSMRQWLIKKTQAIRLAFVSQIRWKSATMVMKNVDDQSLTKNGQG